MEKTAMDAALKTAQHVVEVAGTPPTDRPIAVTIVDLTGRVIVSLAMDGTLPISSELSRKKAVTAVQIKKDTFAWEDTNPANLGDLDLTCFGGGIPVLDYRGVQVGGIGVSGRHSHQEIEGGEGPLQDHELALEGSRFIQSLWPENYY